MIGYVYFIQGMTTTLVKIGYTYRCPLERMKFMQGEGPDILRLVGVIRTDEPFAVEQRIHSWLREYRHHGEWFDSCVLVPLERYIVEYLNDVSENRHHHNRSRQARLTRTPRP